MAACVHDIPRTEGVDYVATSLFQTFKHNIMAS